jgi:uncharacterized protein YkwD
MKKQIILSFVCILISLLIIQCEREKLTDITVTPGPIITNPEFNANETAIIERDIFDTVNQYREENTLNLLIWSNTISKQCRYHSNDIALGNIPFGHDGIETRFEQIKHNFPNAAGTELIYQQNSGYQFSEKAVNFWKDNQNSNQTLIGNFQRSGIGVAKSESGYYIVTIILISQTD